MNPQEDVRTMVEALRDEGAAMERTKCRARCREVLVTALFAWNEANLFVPPRQAAVEAFVELSQQKLRLEWQGQYAVVKTLAEALAAIGYGTEGNG